MSYNTIGLVPNDLAVSNFKNLGVSSGKHLSAQQVMSTATNSAVVAVHDLVVQNLFQAKWGSSLTGSSGLILEPPCCQMIGQSDVVVGLTTPLDYGAVAHYFVTTPFNIINLTDSQVLDGINNNTGGSLLNGKSYTDSQVSADAIQANLNPVPLTTTKGQPVVLTQIGSSMNSGVFITNKFGEGLYTPLYTELPLVVAKIYPPGSVVENNVYFEPANASIQLVAGGMNVTWTLNVEPSTQRSVAVYVPTGIVMTVTVQGTLIATLTGSSTLQFTPTFNWSGGQMTVVLNNISGTGVLSVGPWIQ